MFMSNHFNMILHLTNYSIKYHSDITQSHMCGSFALPHI